MNEYNGVEFYFHVLLTTAPDGDEWLTSGSEMPPPPSLSLSLFRERSPVPVEQRAVYISELMYTVWRKEKVNQSHYRPEVPRGFQEVKVPKLRDNGP